ncbi:MAG TPA: amino acid adenylation domain-containing protein, partial [Herpetosiphonaceae bacterium]
RIELAEIEATLQQHPAVQAAVVMLREDRSGDPRLVAYVVENKGTKEQRTKEQTENRELRTTNHEPQNTADSPSPAQRERGSGGEGLRAFLAAHLPAYMVPSAFVILDELPLTPNGKVDRRALPQPEWNASISDRPFSAPRTPIEALLVQIWIDVLGIEPIGVTDHFFDLGGHSLLATQLMARVRTTFNVELPLRTLFETPTISGLAERVERARSARLEVLRPPLVAASRDQDLPLSFAQQRIWFLEQLDPGSRAYSLAGALRLLGPLDTTALERSFNAIIQRHEALRTTFAQKVSVVDGEPVQRINPAAAIVMPQVALDTLSDTERAAAVERLIHDEVRQPFDLQHGPLLRASLLRLQPDEHRLLISMHHIVSDGWSMSILIHEIITLYHAFTANVPAQLADLPVQYADYALWQRGWLVPGARGDVLDTQLGYWQAQLRDLMPLELPTDYPRPPVQTFSGATHSLSLPPALSQSLEALSQREGVTLFMTLLAGFKVLLHRYSGQDDLVIGTPIAGRTQSEIEGLIGCFINTLILRTDLSGNPTFREILRRVREVSLDAYAHQDLPFEHIVDALQPERDVSRSPLFQVMFVLQNTPIAPLAVPGLQIEPIAVDTGTAKFDLTLTMEASSAGLTAAFEYNTDLFAESTIQRLASHFVALLAGCVADPEQRISALPLLLPAEQQQMLVSWNATHADWSQASLQCRFEDQVARTPNAIAASYEHTSLTYEALNAEANRLAWTLIERGVGPEAVVAILAERDLLFLVGILGIFKAGGAYVPIDPSTPDQRISQIVAQSGAGLILTTEALLPALAAAIEQLPTQPPVAVAEHLIQEQRATTNPPVRVLSDQLAYVIYTSGSTGVPKGAMVEHRGMLNHLDAKIDALQLTAADVVAQTASQSFDISVWQLLAVLLVGGRVAIMGDHVTHDPALLLARVEHEHVSILEPVPSLLHAMLQEIERQDGEHLSLAALRWIIPTGEALPPEVCRRWLATYPHIPLLNAYGPTECSDDVTHHVIRELPAAQTVHIPIGRPIPNLRMYVLDRWLSPVPVGVPGELYVGGVGVGRGYRHDPGKTAEVFVPDPFSRPDETGGARLYKTGDRVRYRADGAIEFLGRIDYQVKLRGYRIELGEIEAALAQHPAVRESLVIVREDVPGRQQLVAYVVGEQKNKEQRNKEQRPEGTKNQEPRTKNQGDETDGSRSPGGHPVLGSALREFLAQRLPEYMIPSAFVLLDALPLTPNGKVDRRALPAPAFTGDETTAFVAPRTPTEELLAAIWADVLGVGKIGSRDRFFELGGHSLLATQVLARVRDAFDVDLPLRTLFESAMLADLAGQIDRARSQQPGDAMALVPVPHAGQAPVSFEQQQLWLFDQLQPGTTIYNIAAAVRLQGPLSQPALQQAFDALVARHEVLRTSFAQRAPAVDGHPQQVIAPTLELDLSIVDLRDEPGDTHEDRTRELAQALIEQPFDLRCGPLLRAMLIVLEPEAAVLVIVLHHIVGDRWSLGLLVRDIGALYTAARTGEASLLRPLPIQYADYAHWQRARLQDAALESQLGYWRNQLANLPRLRIPADYPRPQQPTFRGGTIAFTLSGEISSALHQLSRRTGVTLFMTLLSAFQVLLGRYARQDDVVVGTSVANRHRTQLEDLIGFFVNTLVLRSDLAGEPTFQELLRRVRSVVLDAFTHQDLPFAALVEALQPQRNLSLNPLFQVFFVL